MRSGPCHPGRAGVSPLMPRRRPGWTLGVCRGALLAAALLAVNGCAAGEDLLVLATWNLEHLAAADGAGCRPRTEADYADLRAAADGLDADIVAVQEVEGRAALARVFDPAVYDLVVADRPAAPRQQCRGMPGQQRTAQRTGFAIHRARLAERGLRWRQLPPVAELGAGGGRVGTLIRVEPRAGGVRRDGDGPGLDLLSVHLKSGCAWGGLGPDGSVKAIRRGQCRVLRRQRGELEAWIDAQAAADRAFVVIGDFNRQLDQPRDDFWSAIDDGSVCVPQPDPDLGRRCLPGSRTPDADADLELAGAGRPFPFAHNPRFPYAIDHIVAGGAAADWLRQRSYRPIGYATEPPLSDHRPVRVGLRLPW